MIRKNDRLKVTIEDYSIDGHGIAKADGYVLFVPGAVVGEKVEVHVVKCRASFGYAKIINVLSPSPQRIAPDCPVCHQCGGCVFRHIDYQAELNYKANKVKNNLRRIGGISHPPMTAPLGAENTLGYRNKAQYPIRMQNGKITAGFYAAGSHRIIPAEDCKIQPDVFDNILAFVLRYINAHSLTAYDETTGKGLVRHLYLRRGEHSGEIMVCMVLNGNRLPEDFTVAITKAFPDVVCVCINENREKTNVILGKNTRFLTQRTYITDTLLGKEFIISPASFYQVNRAQTEVLYAKAKELAQINGSMSVLDLYCGIGTVGICAADDAGELVGIEIVEDAVKNATACAQRNHLDNARYICADAGKGAALLLNEGYHFDVVFVDPPRKGCDESTLNALLSLSPEKIVYISCDPATLARDVKFLTAHSYRLQSATPVDLFPRTTHIETVALLSRQKVDEHIYFDVNVQDLPKTARTTATYPEIKAYVKDKYGLNVTSLNIAQVKEKHGFEKRENYNKGKDGHRVPNCPPEKEKAIEDAFKHFGML